MLLCVLPRPIHADIAFYIKHEYDKKYPGSGKATEGVYHCIVGKSFASELQLAHYDRRIRIFARHHVSAVVLGPDTDRWPGMCSLTSPARTGMHGWNDGPYII